MDIHKSKILIVEDSFIVALHLQSTLEGEGYQILATCASGEDALEEIIKERPSLVLMDIMLNGMMDGIETAEIIQQKYNVPVIYISALSDKATIKRAKFTQPYGFLIKPFDDRAIFTTVEMAIHKHEIESKLMQSEQRYTAAVHSTNDVIIVLDTDYCVTFFNKSAAEITQVSVEEAIGKPIGEVLKLQDANTDALIENPLQCAIDLRTSALPSDLCLISKSGAKTFIGESNMSILSIDEAHVNGLVVSFRDITEKRQQEQLLKNAENDKTAALIQGQENERGRIARDLHDGLGQMLNAIKMNASDILPVDKKSSSLYLLIDEAIQECIRISENLLPSKLNDFDLGTCLRSLCDQLNPNVQPLITCKNGKVEMEIDQIQKINLYRIAQEAINNAIKHAEAENITVSLKVENNVIKLAIQDDGKGAAAVNDMDRQGGQGLNNMADRAKMIGGKLNIGKADGQGWLIEAEVPC